MSYYIFSATAALALLAIRYPDRAVFSELPQQVPIAPSYPLVGGLMHQRKNKERFHDFVLDTLTKLDTLTFVSSSLGTPRRITTVDPRNIEHVLKDNFQNYVKSHMFKKFTIELLGNGILSANGEHWKYQRKIASHIFNVKNFRDHFTKIFVQGLQKMRLCVLDKTNVVDFHDMVYRFTLDSFVCIGFGVQLNTVCSEEKVPFAVAFDALQLNSVARALNPLWRWTEKMSWGKEPTVQDHFRTVNEFATNIIKQRRQRNEQGEEYCDLLSRFMQARNENKEPLDDDELRDVILNFIIAGRDTTAQALSWTFYNLALHPRIEKKLLDEIHETMPSDIEDIEAVDLYELIKNMVYAHAVFYEVLRLHPSVPSNSRSALQDDTLPDGTPVSKGDIVSWSIYALGRNEKIWGDDAKQFRPERWITSDGTLRRESQGQWPVFHAGPRVCLGQSLATLEALIAIAFLLKRYKFSLMPGQDITYQLSLTMPMKHGMKMWVEQR